MRLARVATQTLQIPFPTLAADSRYRWCELVLCQLATDDGVEGVGFAYALSGGSHAVSSLIERVLWPLLAGEEPVPVSSHWRRMREATHHMGGGPAAMAVAAADIALWDLAARSRGEPLYRMLGAQRNQVSAYGSGRASVSLDVSELLRAVQSYVDEGFTAVKIRIGRAAPEEDVGRLQAVRKEFGDGLRIMTDANESLTLNTALWLAPRLVEMGVFWLEEPLPAEDVDAHVQLTRRTPLPLAVGEHLFSGRQFGEYLRRRAATVMQPDAAIVGGITEWLQVAAACDVLGQPVVPHFLTELHVHLAAAVPSCPYVEFYPFLETVLEDRLTARNGVVTAPDRPGHGLVFRPDALASHRLT